VVLGFDDGQESNGDQGNLHLAAVFISNYGPRPEAVLCREHRSNQRLRNNERRQLLPSVKDASAIDLCA